ncbi:(E,E)-geranyllinalool synthase [Macadamia integrifolia]|uniref:(E,E)-geranyllinalool synthase n=1 Tax=Macadamia integrifolia TaxID=60698 RepID=UPI001C4E51B3|nr:(E,E)-geranyllinalool synthase [Macadamia integrifolia]
MEEAHLSIQNLVKKVKEEMFSSSLDLYSFVSPSAYDTAWLAMIPDNEKQEHPMFQQCLNWLLNNQNENGLWGESNTPTIYCLPATLACMAALSKWEVGAHNIEKGMPSFHAHAENLLTNQNEAYPHWYSIVFPGMVEVARNAGLEVTFPGGLKEVVESIFDERKQILEMEAHTDQYHYPPLLSYLEALPLTYKIDQEVILSHFNEDGSLFQSPSATAKAYMATGNSGCMMYLKSLIQRCGYGVPHMYPVDEELIKLCMLNQLDKMGVAEHFHEEIEEALADVYRDYMNRVSEDIPINRLPIQMYKDSIAFRLLRMRGYHVSPWNFCWFLHHNDLLIHIEDNYEYFLSSMLSVYRATELRFVEENELEEARSFSRKFLEKAIALSTKNNFLQFPNLQSLIEHELNLPWLARLDHLEHRRYIEENDKTSFLWMGKAPFFWSPYLQKDLLLQLSIENFTFRQSIYKNELEKLKRWTEESGLNQMGFGREKTTYCYFAIAASCKLPYFSEIRSIVAKSAVIVTVADDFFDKEGSLEELEDLTKAIRRWHCMSLRGHGKIIFDALNNLVINIAKIYFEQHRQNVMKYLQVMWYQTFLSWLIEAKWSKSGYVPSIDEYLETGMISVAAHTLVLPAASLMNPALPPKHLIKCNRYETLTKLLMVSSRLLNDTQSYEKEGKDGKMNLVMLYMKEIKEADIQDSVSCIENILDQKKKELLEHALVNDMGGQMPKSCKELHLSCLKVFQMFFYNANRFDSETALLQDIKKAIYDPLEVQVQGSMLPQLTVGHKLKINLLSSNHGNHCRKSLKTSFICKMTSKGWYEQSKFIMPKVILGIV